MLSGVSDTFDQTVKIVHRIRVVSECHVELASGNGYLGRPRQRILQ